MPIRGPVAISPSDVPTRGQAKMGAATPAMFPSTARPPSPAFLVGIRQITVAVVGRGGLGRAVGRKRHA